MDTILTEITEAISTECQIEIPEYDHQSPEEWLEAVRATPLRECCEEVEVIEMSTKRLDEDEATFYTYSIQVGGVEVGQACTTQYDIGSVLDRIDIDEKYRGRGYGQAAIKDLHETFGTLAIQADTVDAARLYARMGLHVFELDTYMQEAVGYLVYLHGGFGLYFLL